jgi:hypothetical protein
MDDLDRLGWADGLAFRSHGVSVGVRVTDPVVLDAVRTKLPPDWRPQSSPTVERLYSVVSGRPAGARSVGHPLVVVYAGSRRLTRQRELEPALDALETDIRHHVAEASPKRVFVHAGVVGWQGRAIVIPGRSFSGKTTLVVELVRRGATYFSDEYAVLDGRGRVRPFAKPLSIRSPGSHHSDEHPVTDIGGVAATRPLPIGLVAITEFREGCTWRPRALSVGEGALAMLGNTVPARSRPAHVLQVLREALPGSSILKGPRGEAAAVAEALLAGMSAHESVMEGSGR